VVIGIRSRIRSHIRSGVESLAKVDLEGRSKGM
jgi:hypothetical protein